MYSFGLTMGVFFFHPKMKFNSIFVEYFVFVLFYFFFSLILFIQFKLIHDCQECGTTKGKIIRFLLNHFGALPKKNENLCKIPNDIQQRHDYKLWLRVYVNVCQKVEIVSLEAAVVRSVLRCYVLCTRYNQSFVAYTFGLNPKTRLFFAIFFSRCA